MCIRDRPLACGGFSVRSEVYGETMHCGIGPEKEAQSLYVEQLNTVDRLKAEKSLTLWDIGLGAGANTFAAFSACKNVAGHLTVISFDRSLEPIQLACASADKLPYVKGYEAATEVLLSKGKFEGFFDDLQVTWQVVQDDFSKWIHSPAAKQAPAPQLIFFDAYSASKNPEMWAVPIFKFLYEKCQFSQTTLATYSRSASARTSLLAGGFFVGRGQATGLKEETTVAASNLSLLKSPFDHTWLSKLHRSSAAEPLWTAEYIKQPLTPKTLQLLESHPQFLNKG